MFVIKLKLVLFLNIFYVSDCSRRIQEGIAVTEDKTYVVYLVKAPTSDKVYDAWLCGGALVSPVFIITSAACVDDVEYMYAIAGYKKYIRDDQINTDECASQKRKKVVYTCVPTNYELNYYQVEKWSLIDIALARVESPYDLEDESFKTVCSYIPTVIPINYEAKFQRPGIDALVYGWGHLQSWRPEQDTSNYNQKWLRYASTKIIDKSACKEEYKQFTNMTDIIEQYMICTLDEGEINDRGELNLFAPEPKKDGCDDEPKDTLSNEDYILPENDDPDVTEEATRRKHANNQTNNEPLEIRNGTIFKETMTRSRKNGICQNDHGGPLVTWVGGREILIGVASVFKLSDDMDCVGPYLYTSTFCNGAFLHCVLSDGITRAKPEICDQPARLRGFDTVEKHISWRRHPAGPAENEIVSADVKYADDETFIIRPQRPLHDYNVG